MKFFASSLLILGGVIVGLQGEIKTEFLDSIKNNTAFKKYQVFIKGGYEIDCKLKEYRVTPEFDFAKFQCPALGDLDVYTSGVYAKLSGLESENCMPESKDNISYVACVF